MTLSVACLATILSSAQTAELLESYTIEDIENIVSAFGFPDGLIELTYEVDVYKITYETLHPNGEMVVATGALCLPSGVVCPLPLSSYQHGTVALKTNVPSHLNSETNLGVLYASSGFATTMPDFIGLGDSPGMHLYVHADSEASASFDLIQAAEGMQEELGFNLDGQLFLWGYSQGGHATLALQRLVETEYSEEYTITASAPMSGPYDISGVQAEYLTGAEAYPTPGYLPYVVLSYQEVYGTLYEELEDVFLPEYAAIIPDLFDGTVSMGAINASFPSIPSQCLLPEVFEAFESDPEHPIRVALEDNDLYNWTPTAPTNLYYCEGDDQVSYLNAIVALEAFVENGSTSVDALNGGDFDHGGCAPIAMLGAYNWFNELYEPYFGPEVSIDVLDETAEGAEDGSITVTVENAEEDWTYSWSTGDTGNVLNNVPMGTYQYTITTAEGCSKTWDIEVGGAVGISSTEELTAFQLFPQPATSQLTLSNHAFTTLTIRDISGRTMETINVKGIAIVDVNQLSSGIFFFTFDEKHTFRVIKQ